ncbi:unnamed protein product [Lymnaea stagnalis]|uniref:C2H2-type domain-containing protein n=1 Tax=Lymnaea stagnalis TaxID=6523 RepID=A0AAV2H7V9_LYMST
MDLTNNVIPKEELDQTTYFCKFEGCSKSFKRKDRLEIHVRSHTGERPFVCDFGDCKNAYSRFQHLSRHTDRVHKKGCKDRLKVRCPVCQLELANSSCLKKHEASFHGKQPSIIMDTYKCPHEGCCYAFHKKKQLMAHRLEHTPHVALAKKCHSCPYEGCNKTFTFPNKLRQHLKVHQGYPCDSEGCGQVFPNWSTLRKHKAKDHAPTHSCKICNAVFKQKSNLTQHIKIHATSREPLTCPKEKCGRIFFYKKNVDQHVKEFHEGGGVKRKKRKRNTPDVHMKKKVSKNRLMAARLCGIDDREDLNFDIKLNTSEPTQNFQENFDSSTDQPQHVEEDSALTTDPTQHVQEESALSTVATKIDVLPLSLSQATDISMSESNMTISSGLCNHCGQETEECRRSCHLTQCVKADPRVPTQCVKADPRVPTSPHHLRTVRL